MKVTRIIFIYILSISVVLLGMRPLLYSLAKIPQSLSWNINNAEEEEEHKKTKDEKERNQYCDSEESYLVASRKHFYTFYFLHIKDVHLSYPTPPPEA